MHLFFLPGDEQKSEAREKGILTDSDIQMEMALRSTAAMTDEDTAAMNAALSTEGEQDKTTTQNEVPFVYDPTVTAAAAAAAAAAAGMASFEQLQKQQENKHAVQDCSLHLPPSGPTTEGIEIDMIAAARRFTTYSSEDALAGMLFDTIVSPQTVLPNRANEAKNINNNDTLMAEFPLEGASATKPKLTRAEALAAAMGELNTDGIDLKELMTTGQQQQALLECSLPGSMQISPGLLASLSADLECPQEGEGHLPVTRALFV